MKFSHNLLFISSQYLDGDNSSQQVLEEFQTELAKHGFKIHITYQIPDGLKTIRKSPQHSGIGLYWELDSPTLVEELQHLTGTFRKRNTTTPLVIFLEQNITDHIPLDVLKEVSEYVYLFSESAAFTVNRLYSLAHHYADELLPSHFKTLKDSTEDGDHHWDRPGHTGGIAYPKHPVGIELINFFGENMMCADIGVATTGVGDYLIHARPPKKSEEIVARLFGSDWIFYGVSGSSGSNRIVTQAAVGADEIAIIDRNCHKSLNHSLTLSQARPVYLRPTRNTWGLIGSIPTGRLKKVSIDALVANSRLVSGAVSQSPSYAVVTNCICDDFHYNMNDAVRHLGESTPRIHSDEAWYAYARFHPLYQSCYTMGTKKAPSRPTLLTIQSIHKMLPLLPMASMIHVKKSDRASPNFDDLNDAFMMHDTTSPYYPVIASIDVVVSMMEGEPGYSFVQESTEEAIAFRKVVVSVKYQLQEQEDGDTQSFDVLQLTEVQDSDSGQRYSSEEAPVSLLNHNADCWSLRFSERWHGFADDDLVETNSMLDPVKVTLTCPGIGPKGEYQKNGTPGCSLTRFPDDHRIETACTGDYTVLILFSVGITKGKWGTLTESLLAFKKHYNNDDLATDAISSLKACSPHYDTLTLKELCQIMCEKMDELELMPHINDAVNTDLEPVMTPAEACQKVVRYKTEHIRLGDLSGRIATNMFVLYPPGTPVLMPGEWISQGNKGIIGYLRALQEFDEQFPGFEHEIQGANVDENGDFWARVIVEEECNGQLLPGHITFRRQVFGIKKGRQQAGERTISSDHL